MARRYGITPVVSLARAKPPLSAPRTAGTSLQRVRVFKTVAERTIVSRQGHHMNVVDDSGEAHGEARHRYEVGMLKPFATGGA